MAISVDPSAVTRAHVAKNAWTFTFLADPDAKAIRRYDLQQEVGDGKLISRPAELLVDPQGTVRWRDLTHDFRVRTRPETVLQVFDRLTAR